MVLPLLPALSSPHEQVKFTMISLDSFVPPGRSAARDLRKTAAQRGLHLDPRTTKPGWLGERLDVGYAIDVMHPRALGR